MKHVKADHWFFIEGESKPTIECPRCSMWNLGQNAPHGVRANGEVYQSVVCAHAPCDFHDFVILDEWNGGEIPHD